MMRNWTGVRITLPPPVPFWNGCPRDFYSILCQCVRVTSRLRRAKIEHRLLKQSGLTVRYLTNRVC